MTINPFSDNLSQSSVRICWVSALKVYEPTGFNSAKLCGHQNGHTTWLKSTRLDFSSSNRLSPSIFSFISGLFICHYLTFSNDSNFRRTLVATVTIVTSSVTQLVRTDNCANSITRLFVFSCRSFCSSPEFWMSHENLIGNNNKLTGGELNFAYLVIFLEFGF